MKIFFRSACEVYCGLVRVGSEQARKKSQITAADYEDYYDSGENDHPDKHGKQSGADLLRVLSISDDEDGEENYNFATFLKEISRILGNFWFIKFKTPQNSQDGPESSVSSFEH